MNGLCALPPVSTKLKYALVNFPSPLFEEKTIHRPFDDHPCQLSLQPRLAGTDPEPHPVDSTTDYWIVTLATDALLLDIEQLAGAGQTELRQAYEIAWKEIGKWALEAVRKCGPKPCESPIRLQHYFSQEKLVGGDYLHRRFRGADETYAPYLITGAGSVFVLSSKPDDADAVKDLFYNLLRSGLPLRKWAQDKFKRNGKSGEHHSGGYWENCPFIPQNGYGEIVVNHPAQIDLLHDKKGVKPTPVKTVVCQ